MGVDPDVVKRLPFGADGNPSPSSTGRAGITKQGRERFSTRWWRRRTIPANPLFLSSFIPSAFCSCFVLFLGSSFPHETEITSTYRQRCRRPTSDPVCPTVFVRAGGRSAMRRAGSRPRSGAGGRLREQRRRRTIRRASPPPSASIRPRPSSRGTHHRCALRPLHQPLPGV